ncbi:MAG: hypothetical protein IKQ89_05495, partial [Muribaculaceae bacterium]|nr:hypothetical protein [Muribaculaceae bacterium]
VGYFMIDSEGKVDMDYLDACETTYESEWARVVQFSQPLTIAINGPMSRGVVFKPGCDPINTVDVDDD